MMPLWRLLLAPGWTMLTCKVAHGRSRITGSERCLKSISDANNIPIE